MGLGAHCWLIILLLDVYAAKNFFSSTAGRLRTSLPSEAFCQTQYQGTVDSKQNRDLEDIKKLIFALGERSLPSLKREGRVDPGRELVRPVFLGESILLGRLIHSLGQRLTEKVPNECHCASRHWYPSPAVCPKTPRLMLFLSSFCLKSEELPTSFPSSNLARVLAFQQWVVGAGG